MTLVGTCAEFCPKREVEERTRNKQVDPLFEREILIKRYARPAAGRSMEKSENVRPPEVLLRTVEYMFTETVKLTDFPKSYPFIWDRLWAVRQDLTFQQSACAVTRKILVGCVKFYTVSRVLCAGNVSLSVFDPKINCTHLVDTLGKLIRIYEEFAIEDEERPRMESLWLLLHLHSSKMLHRALNLPAKTKSEMKTALRLALSSNCSNSFRFLQLTNELDVLEWCIVGSGLNAVRLELLRILNTGFSSKTCAFPVSILSEWLNCYECDCIKLLNFCGLPLDENSNVNFLKTRPNCRFHDDETIEFQSDNQKDEISDNLTAILLL